MANDSYLRQLTRNVVLTSLLAGSALGVGCALHRPQNIQQNSIDVKLWRRGSDSLLVDYYGNIFYIVGAQSLQSETASAFVERMAGELSPTEKFKPELIKKGADLLTIIDGNREEFEHAIPYQSSLSEDAIKYLQLNRPQNITTLNPKEYFVPIPTQFKSMTEAGKFYSSR